ncbi:hypothetical protein LOZ12_001993 [Ophidiomyces ophidiicola]|uniref:Uncharacterized protein n=1 Tax=Ophidiomyces ophidiicola TaxID=1387563 RepID=A0ACB8V2G3_9EURO|nr:uncharacterized protein LOZ57_001538 [Ophidiomyces ophidiicola]KAI1908946.1 hypothetical protein LOZ61_005290 [Ophidiomyces ophidiicola]KAI1919096.1 hypothetical protein LOZ64_002468 [Ophidiomyces ophidiicola]KAI1926816.1 hypothetical protein LOZ60_003413 [Ophidiomyces ophidiicola]KAI1950989.1 hypothetical protein LOZ57_001538 [Ophidiomyces ophidiicola]KAI1952216.1 hypothetical protein LOZ62_001529 [Ophidiomyces ophidiicola]
MGIKQTAAKMSAKLNISFSEVYQPKTENNGDPSPPSVIYLLISPLLPPMSLFVTMSFLTPNKRLSTRVDGTFVTGLQPREALTSHRCLAIYGDNDSFTSVKRLRIWSQELSSIPGSLFKTLEIPGAGHFWRESGAEGAMRNAIQEYIQTHLL